MHALGSSSKSIIESVEMGWLPSPPPIFSKALDICHDPDSSIDDLADIISIDAVLTSKLIMAVNTAAFSNEHPVSDLKQAITLIGHDLVKNMVLTSAIQQLFAGMVNSRKKVVCDAWLDSLYCAVFADHIARASHYENPQDAYLAGLLHNFGQIVLDVKFHEQYIDILDSESESNLVHEEITRFGVSHTELGASYIEQWPSLSPAIADAVRFHHEEELVDSDMLCQIVAEASQIAAHWSRFGGPDLEWQSAIVDVQALNNIYIQAKAKVSQIAVKLGIPPPGSGSITQDQLSGDLERVTIRLGRKIRDASLINVICSEETLPAAASSPRDLLLKIARELQLLFSISDLVMLFPDSKDAGFLTLYELNHLEPISRFPVENTNSKVVRSFLEKRQFWIEADSRHNEIMPISDRQIVRRLNHDIACSLPIGHGDKVIGTLVIGSSKAQKNYLASQSEFISGYLKNIADLWLKTSQVKKQQAFEDDTKKEQDEKDIEKLIHEISNPLTVIGNYIEIIKTDSMPDGGEYSKEIEVLKEEVQRIGNIVINFKETKFSESNTVFLNDELKMCIPLYIASTGDDKEVQVSWNLDELDSEIKITRDALRQIVLNLVKNAVEAQTDNIEITVSSHNFVNIDGVVFAQFSVADRGRGVDAITRRLLFSSLASTKEGTSRGFGLSVVAEILGNFNGKIQYMENEGGGAVFEVSIPLLLK